MMEEQRPKGEPYTELDLSRDLAIENILRLRRYGISLKVK